MRLTLLLALAFLPACRNLELPQVTSLTIEAPRDTVAPRQKVQLSASGGSGSGYVFDFAPNGKSSGDLASITPDGLYQAGERGFAQDTLRVTDSAGGSARVLVTVGPPLSVSPPLSAVAPGGRIVFTASGGLPPWKFSLVDGTELPNGDYRAAPPANRVDTVIVTDATNDPAAETRAQVSIGNGLTLFPANARLAPGERLGFVALGGQAPYVFSLGPTSGSGGTRAPTIDAATGLYVAGANDSTMRAPDEVIVTDSNGQTASALVEVGPPLEVSTLGQVGHPGMPLQVSATGGRPPYTFGFQPRGNRSRGTIDALAGVYRPGPNSGAIDLIQVSDVTGSVANAAQVVVGSLQVVVPSGGSQMVVGDFDGDSLRDLALLYSNQLTTVTAAGQRSSGVRSDYLSSAAGSYAMQMMPWDSDGNTRTDLFVTGNSSMMSLRAGLGGRFDFLEQEEGVWTFARAARIGDHVYRARRETCVGIERLSLSTVARLSLDGGFVAPTQTCPFPVTGPVFAIAANDNATAPWLAWFAMEPRVPGELSRASQPAQFRYLDPGQNVVRSATLTMPTGHRMTERARLMGIGVTTNGLNMILDKDDQAGAGRALILVDEIDAGTTRIWGIDTAVPQTAFLSATIPTPFPAAGFAGSVSAGGRVRVAAWDTRTGNVPVLDVDPDAGTSLQQTLLVDYAVSSAGFVDLNGDNQSDLVTTGAMASIIDIFWGDGDGRFGRRPRFDVDDPRAAQVVDIDGDGVTDVVSPSRGGLNVFFGAPGQRQLAVGPRTPMLVNPSQLVVDEFDGDGRLDALFQDDQGALWLAVGAGNPGQFAPPRQVVNLAGVPEFAIASEMLRTDLGGAAPGPDLLTIARNPLTTVTAPLAIVRTGAAVAHRVFLPTPSGVFAAACTYHSMQIDGTGPEELLATCPDNMGFVRLFTASVSGSGAGVTFSAWQASSTTPLAGSYAVLVPPRPADPRRFLMLDDRLVVVSADGGSLSLAQHPTPQIDLAVLANLTGADGGEPDLVGYSFAEGAMLVLRWNGTTWVEAQRLVTGDTARVDLARVSPLRPPDVLFGGRTGPELQFLENDGGVLR